MVGTSGVPASDLDSAGVLSAGRPTKLGATGLAAVGEGCADADETGGVRGGRIGAWASRIR